NWAMVPLYTSVFQEPNYPKSEYGIQTEIMAYVAVLMTLLTYGMETSFFRYSSDNKENKSVIFATSQTSLLISSLFFVVIIWLFLPMLSGWFGIANRSYILVFLAITLAIDAYSSIPFVKLRLESRALRFASIKLLNILINVGANLFFFLFCPYWLSKYPDSWLTTIYHHDVGIGYVFISYFLAAFCTLLFLLPTLKGSRLALDKKILSKMLKYGLPIMLVGLASMLNINFDKIAMKMLLTGDDIMGQLGEYGAAFKLGVLMTLFTQAYRYAFEPFFFTNKTAENSKQLYADALKFFTIIGLLGFLGVVFYIDFIGLLLGKSYREALPIVPYILLANLFLGIYYSLSLWYKLTDKTHYGAYLAFGGAAITLLLNILLVPRIGYIGSAYAFLASTFCMVLASYYLGQKHYPVPYAIKRILGYFALAIFLFIISTYISIENIVFVTILKTL
ncbi:MAG: hypothetical protein CR987_00795, partial [Draconibacterium sp.]